MDASSGGPCAIGIKGLTEVLLRPAQHVLWQGAPAVRAVQPPEMQKKMKNVMRGVSLLIPALSTALPASVFMYWTGGWVG